MKNYLLILVLLLGGPISAQVVVVNEAEAEISFNFIDDDVDGTFGDFQFTGNINLDALENSVFSGSVVTKTIDTNNWLRSRHLRARKYFNASDFPKITFASTSVSGTKDEFQVNGTLMIKGIKNTVHWKFESDGQRLLGTTTVNTHDFDISIHDDKVRNKVKLFVILPY